MRRSVMHPRRHWEEAQPFSSMNTIYHRPTVTIIAIGAKVKSGVDSEMQELLQAKMLI
jgi:hypothetical protein